MGTDPTERPRQWLGFAFLCGLAVITLPTLAWELVIRRAHDPGVWSGCLVLTSIILIGPVGIKIVQLRRGDPSDNGAGV